MSKKVFKLITDSMTCDVYRSSLIYEGYQIMAELLLELPREQLLNWMFQCLSELHASLPALIHVYRYSEYHKQVRGEVVKQVRCLMSYDDDQRDTCLIYESYVPMKYKRYYKRMAKLGEWGDHITLQAAADRFAAKICLLTSFRDTCFIEIMPQDQAPKRELWLSFWSEVHYNSLYDIQAVPVQQKPKRKHWLY
uniref:OTU domain-containing protein n=1 Tax=Brassica oleracea TaxID=3712 RepID=A0A3P6ANW4_BRAOL|nr:unnamed protein product [Brassica oleracea]